MKFSARILVAGNARGPVAAIAPLSFWGGLDPETGTIIDRSHPDLGCCLAGTVLVMPSGRGSSSSSSVLAEAIRLGTAPAAIVLAEPDPILAVGAMVAEALYHRTCPIFVLSGADHERAAELHWLGVGIDGEGLGFVSGEAQHA
jgi:predicted aconitase with swiveling domain